MNVFLGGAQSLLNSAPNGALGFDLAACNNYQNGMNAASKLDAPFYVSGSQDKMSPSLEGMKLRSYSECEISYY